MLNSHFSTFSAPREEMAHATFLGALVLAACCFSEALVLPPKLPLVSSRAHAPALSTSSACHPTRSVAVQLCAQGNRELPLGCSPLRRKWRQLKRIATTAARSLAIGAFLVLPGKLPFSQGTLEGRPQALAVQRVTDRETAAAVEILLEEEKPSVLVKFGKVAVAGGAIGLGVTAALKVKGMSEEQRRAEEAKEYLESMLKSEKTMKPAEGIEINDDGPDDDASPSYAKVLSTDGSLQESFSEQLSRPTPPPPPAPPKRPGLNLFSKRQAVSLPTVQELTEGDTPQAALCKTVAFGMSAPTDLTAAMVSAEVSDVPLEDNGEAVFAMTVLEELEGAYNSSLAAGMDLKEMAKCLEQVGRAKLIELVDAASQAVGEKEEFASAATRLCNFVANAGFTVNALKLTKFVGEVLYEGNEPRRRLERVYRNCLALAAPELLATMGLGDEEEAAGTVGLDAVEQLRPLLKIKENTGQKLMQDVIQKQMVEVMKGDSDGAGGGKAMARSVEMLEQLLNSGSIQKQDLESLKSMLAQSMGMPVEEILERKDELQAELPPEGKKLFDLIERLFSKDGGSESMKKAEGSTEELDPALLGADMKVTVKPKALPANSIDDTAPSPPGTSVKIKVKGPGISSPSVPPAASPPPVTADNIAPLRSSPPPSTPQSENLTPEPPTPPLTPTETEGPAVAESVASTPLTPPVVPAAPAPPASPASTAPTLPAKSAPPVADLPPDWKPYVPYGGKAALMKPGTGEKSTVPETEESAIASQILDNAISEMSAPPSPPPSPVAPPAVPLAEEAKAPIAPPLQPSPAPPPPQESPSASPASLSVPPPSSPPPPLTPPAPPPPSSSPTLSETPTPTSPSPPAAPPPPRAELQPLSPPPASPSSPPKPSPPAMPSTASSPPAAPEDPLTGLNALDDLM